ncbi:hypothetical protein ADUPG1_008749 [Aduncisulcus paluster]|uniref:Uncharacterized protein n=1 Tax=Aduncisulcus paluster TaxID=2918883 RepID=A0ABQ5KT30_9EUKA|nr:hypothetical protein ADUPG1_008749 [Aduncisulcus paluster]
MGVCHITSYVLNSTHLLHKTSLHKLRKKTSHVIIDFPAILYHFSSLLPKNRFYDYLLLINYIDIFITSFLQLKFTVHIIADGCVPSAKLRNPKVIIPRRQRNLVGNISLGVDICSSSSVDNGFSVCYSFFPVVWDYLRRMASMKQFDHMIDLVIAVNGEADSSIITYASFYRGVVIGKDSDFMVSPFVSCYFPLQGCDFSQLLSPLIAEKNAVTKPDRYSIISFDSNPIAATSCLPKIEPYHVNIQHAPISVMFPHELASSLSLTQLQLPFLAFLLGDDRIDSDIASNNRKKLISYLRYESGPSGMSKRKKKKNKGSKKQAKKSKSAKKNFFSFLPHSVLSSSKRDNTVNQAARLLFQLGYSCSESQKHKQSAVLIGKVLGYSKAEMDRVLDGHKGDIWGGSPKPESISMSSSLFRDYSKIEHLRKSEDEDQKEDILDPSALAKDIQDMSVSESFVPSSSSSHSDTSLCVDRICKLDEGKTEKKHEKEGEVLSDGGDTISSSSLSSSSLSSPQSMIKEDSKDILPMYHVKSDPDDISSSSFSLVSEAPYILVNKALSQELSVPTSFARSFIDTHGQYYSKRILNFICMMFCDIFFNPQAKSDIKDGRDDESFDRIPCHCLSDNILGSIFRICSSHSPEKQSSSSATVSHSSSLISIIKLGVIIQPHLWELGVEWNSFLASVSEESCQGSVDKRDRSMAMLSFGQCWSHTCFAWHCAEQWIRIVSQDCLMGEMSSRICSKGWWKTKLPHEIMVSSIESSPISPLCCPIDESLYSFNSESIFELNLCICECLFTFMQKNRELSSPTISSDDSIFSTIWRGKSVSVKEFQNRWTHSFSFPYSWFGCLFYVLLRPCFKNLAKSKSKELSYPSRSGATPTRQELHFISSSVHLIGALFDLNVACGAPFLHFIELLLMNFRGWEVVQHIHSKMFAWMDVCSWDEEIHSVGSTEFIDRGDKDVHSTEAVSLTESIHKFMQGVIVSNIESRSSPIV